VNRQRLQDLPIARCFAGHSGKIAHSRNPLRLPDGR
jgi:hypothetical protein